MIRPWEYEKIPAHTMETLENYINDFVPTGGFLEAVLSNDLVDAFSHADEENRAALPAIVGYLYNKAPGVCWGSRDRVKAWLALRGKTAESDTP